MKYMKVGTKPDTFYTQDATRSVLTDVPPDLIIQINNTRYLLHKFPLLLKCGLLHRQLSTSDEGPLPSSISLHGIPGAETGFELCAKFCYGIAINLSAHNFAHAMAAALHLRMTDSVAGGNFVPKLESFFSSCILHGWKDSIVVLLHSAVLPDEQRFVIPCVDAVAGKILTPPSDVTWSFTYSRARHVREKRRSAPKDWWTEDVSELDLDLFRAVIFAVRSRKQLLPALVGEALHVYACKHLPDPDDPSARDAGEEMGKQRRVLEAIASMLPSEIGAVSGRFVVRLLKVSAIVGASASVRAELLRRAGLQLDEVGAGDLLFPLKNKPRSYDVDMVEAILENFLAGRFRRSAPTQAESQRRLRSTAKVAGVFDSYLEAVARDPELPASKFLGLISLLPEIAREEHDGLYGAIDTFFKEHPELSKSDRKQICRAIDCRKLSPEARRHAVANDRLPLRTVVQLLFAQQEKASSSQSREASSLRYSLDSANLIQKQQEEGRRRRRRREEKERTTMETKVATTEQASVSSTVIERKQRRGKQKEEQKKI
ncbi:BTB/POZ domain-containing protein [Apostasia shenzhenica]|uniref:BTB/POZ domain-containing protein n=1 Tax=Apostasia shenzhenica TaxID=1088818 RepID=A0A2H9ZW28_9ASPA|nr:BTB/POZ domain-containing protein [Apostasia shenzhenica]